MTRLTKDTEFREIFHQYISPIKLMMTIVTFKTTINAEKKENPVKIKVTMKITPTANPRKLCVSHQIDRYCS